MWAEIAAYSFYPDRDAPEYGALHVQQAAFRGDLGGRATVARRGGAESSRSSRLTAISGSRRKAWDRSPGTGRWRQRWPDRGYDGFADEDIWSEPFTFDAEGRPVVLE